MKTQQLKISGLLALIVLPALLAACNWGSSGSSGPKVSAQASTITATPGPLTADGVAASTIGVTLRDSSGDEVENSSATVVISADPCSDCTLSYTDKDGVISGTLTSKAAETITLSFTVNDDASPNSATVGFVAGPPSLDKSTITISAPKAAAGIAAAVNAAAAGSSGTADGVTPLIATVTLYDQFGNRVTKGGEDINIGSSGGAVGPVTDNGDGTYTAKVTSMVPGDEDVGFSVNGSPSPNAVAAAFTPPPPEAASAYMAPWTLEVCKVEGDVGCDFSGIYLANASDPAAPATLAVPGALMGVSSARFSAISVVVDRATYDPSTGIISQLGPGKLVYAQSNALWSLDLTSTAPVPARLSTLAPTLLCEMTGVGVSGFLFGGNYTALSTVGEPTWIEVSGYDETGRTQDDCSSADHPPTLWLLPADGNAATVPLVISPDSAVNGVFGSLVDPATGQFQGLLVQSGADIELYSPNLDQHSTLATGILPSDATAGLMTFGFNDTLILDVGTVSGGTRSDAFYRLDKNGATLLTTLSAAADNPYFARCTFSGNAHDYFPNFAADTARNIYFTYPTDSGFELEKFAPGASSPVTIYNETADWCDDQPGRPAMSAFMVATQDRVAFAEGDFATGLLRVVSVADGGPADQAPAVLTSEDHGVLFFYYYSATGGNVWLEDFHCNADCSAGTPNIIVVRPDGTQTQTFASADIGGDAQQGILAANDDTLRKYIALVLPPFWWNGACAGVGGWVLYDPVTLTPVASPDFGADSCSNTAFMFGPNGSFLLSSVNDASGRGISAFALYGAATLVKLWHYDLPSGAAHIILRPLL